MIFIGADHRGFDLKEQLKQRFLTEMLEYFDCGNMQKEDGDDFPDFAFAVGKQVAISESGKDFGLLLCGSGEGMTIAANKVKGIRAALCNDEDDARAARNDSDANILVLNERHDIDNAMRIVKTFISTPFSGEERFVRRIKKISDYEN